MKKIHIKPPEIIWNKISDGVPPIETEGLSKTKNGKGVSVDCIVLLDNSVYRVGKMVDGNWHIQNCYQYVHAYTVTHWQQLPYLDINKEGEPICDGFGANYLY